MGHRNHRQTTHHHHYHDFPNHSPPQHIPSDEVGRLCRHIESDYRTSSSIIRLRHLNISLEQYRRYGVKQLAQGLFGVYGLEEDSRRLVQKIERMEEEEWNPRDEDSECPKNLMNREGLLGRYGGNFREPIRPIRTVSAPSRRSHGSQSQVSGGSSRRSRSPVVRYFASSEYTECSRPSGPPGEYGRPLTSRPMPVPLPPDPVVAAAPKVPKASKAPKAPKAPPPKVQYMPKPPGLRDLSESRDVPEEDYDLVRPTLIHMTARELKDFMDRNPKIDAIADGLFRRHCQMDCPEEMWRKPTLFSKWRTLHDVCTNWKMYEEMKNRNEE